VRNYGDGMNTPRAMIRSTGEPATYAPQERKLWAEVLERACEDWRTGRYRYAKEREDDRDWFRSDRVAPTTFAWVCQVFELDPDAIRQTLRIV
jgi:hypothetical protein